MSKNKGQAGQQRPTNQPNHAGQQHAAGKTNPQAGQIGGQHKPANPAQASHKSTDGRTQTNHRDTRGTR